MAKWSSMARWGLFVAVLCVACGPPAEREGASGGGPDATGAMDDVPSVFDSLPGFRPERPVTPSGTADIGSSEDVGATGDVGGIEAVDGTGEAPEVAPPTLGSCPAGPLQCPAGWGCALGECGACTTAEQCGPRDGCRASGWCGACSTDAECRLGETCRHGVCMAPVPTWDLLMAPADFDAMVEGSSKEDWYECSVRVGDHEYHGGQVRLRGGSSLEAPKRSFRVEFPKGSSHPGYSRKINLRAEWNDPSYLRNLLAAETFWRMTRVPAFRTRFVRLLVNGETYGLMSEVERIGEAFLEERGLSDSTPLYDADPPNSAAREGIAHLIPLPSASDYELAYDKQSGAGDHSDLIAFIENVVWKDFEDSPSWDHTTTTRLRANADVDLIVEYLGVMAALQAHDHVRKNYVIAALPAASGEAWAFVPWDLDLTFGCLYDMKNDDTVCDHLVVDEWFDAGTLKSGMKATYPTSDYFNMLIHLVVNDPELREQLQRRTCEVMTSSWWVERMPAAIDAWQEVLAPFVEEDVRDLNQGVEDFLAATEEVRAFLAARHEFLGEYIGCPKLD